MQIILNGQKKDVPDGLTVEGLLRYLNIEPARVAVELNLEVVKKAEYSVRIIKDGDSIEVVSFMAGGISSGKDGLEGERDMNDDKLVIAGIEFRSRLWVGTGKYKDFEETRRAIEASGTDVVTVAVRRVNIIDKDKENLLDYIDPKKYKILPNTAGCYTAKDAIRTAMLAADAGITRLVKLEVIGDERTLFPDNEALLEAARVLVKEGLIVLPYTNDDPIMAKKLVDVGCPAVMPLAAPIGSGLGIRNPYNLRIILETVNVPIIVDAGVGTASDVAVAMEMGCDAVLLNTAIAGAKDPIAMAEAMKYGVLAGRLAYKAGRIPKKLYATASSPLEGVIGS